MAASVSREVHVTFCLTSALGEHEVRAAVEQLSAEERARYERLGFERDRRDFLVGHALLRQALSVHGHRAPHEWTFQTSPNGKPFLSSDPGNGAPLSFNLTHT